MLNARNTKSLTFFFVMILAYSNAFGCSRAIKKVVIDTITNKSAFIEVEMIALKSNSIRIALPDTAIFQTLSRNVVIDNKTLDSCTVKSSGFLFIPDSSWSAILDSTGYLNICHPGLASNYKLQKNAIDWVSRKPTDAEQKSFERFCTTAMVTPAVITIGLFSLLVYSMVK